MSELTDAYRVMQEHCGIEVGDTVRVLRGHKPRELGCDVNKADIELSKAAIGKVFTVTEIDPLSIRIDRIPDGGWFPFFCLELVEKAKKATYLPSLGVSFEKDGLTVGGTFVSTDTIRRNLGL